MGTLAAIFAGGALGSIARFSIQLVTEISAIPVFLQELLVTSLVNLSGAFLLGLVHSVAQTKSKSWNGFWGTGFAGGFTTMSGLALITTGSELGLSSFGFLYWLAVAAQLVLGVIAYGIGRNRFGFSTSKNQVSS